MSTTDSRRIRTEVEVLFFLHSGQALLLVSVAALADAENADATNASSNDYCNDEDSKESVNHLLESDFNLHFNFSFLSDYLGLLNERNRSIFKSVRVDPVDFLFFFVLESVWGESRWVNRVNRAFVIFLL